MAQNYSHATREACEYLGIKFEDIPKNDLELLYNLRDRLYSLPCIRGNSFNEPQFTYALYLAVLFNHLGISLTKKKYK